MINISLNIMRAKKSKMNAVPLVILEKNFGFGDFPIIVNVELNAIIHAKIPDKNIMTIIKREFRSGKLKSLNRIIVPTEVHHK